MNKSLAPDSKLMSETVADKRYQTKKKPAESHQRMLCSLPFTIRNRSTGLHLKSFLRWYRLVGLGCPGDCLSTLSGGWVPSL